MVEEPPSSGAVVEPGGGGDVGSSAIGSQEISGAAKMPIVLPGACSVSWAIVNSGRSAKLTIPSWSALLEISSRLGSSAWRLLAAGWYENPNSTEVWLLQVIVPVSCPKSPCCCRDTMSVAGRLDAYGAGRKGTITCRGKFRVMLPEETLAAFRAPASENNSGARTCSRAFSRATGTIGLFGGICSVPPSVNCSPPAVSASVCEQAGTGREKRVPSARRGRSRCAFAEPANDSVSWPG